MKAAKIKPLLWLKKSKGNKYYDFQVLSKSEEKLIDFYRKADDKYKELIISFARQVSELE